VTKGMDKQEQKGRRDGQHQQAERLISQDSADENTDEQGRRREVNAAGKQYTDTVGVYRSAADRNEEGTDKLGRKGQGAATSSTAGQGASYLSKQGAGEENTTGRAEEGRCCGRWYADTVSVLPVAESERT